MQGVTGEFRVRTRSQVIFRYKCFKYNMASDLHDPSIPSYPVKVDHKALYSRYEQKLQISA